MTPGKLLWEDLEGKLTLTMLSGTMISDSVYVEVQSGGNLWGADLAITPTDIVPTPIPAAVFLFGSGLLGLIGIRRKI